eukprot:scaffold6281_cov149-Isochrysis_galbana.AAC.1
MNASGVLDSWQHKLAQSRSIRPEVISKRCAGEPLLRLEIFGIEHPRPVEIAMGPDELLHHPFLVDRGLRFMVSIVIGESTGRCDDRREVNNCGTCLGPDGDLGARSVNHVCPSMPRTRTFIEFSAKPRSTGTMDIVLRPAPPRPPALRACRKIHEDRHHAVDATDGRPLNPIFTARDIGP